MSRWILFLVAAAASLQAAAQEPRAVALPAARFQGAPLQARFDESGKRVVVETLVGACEFAFDPLFANPEGPLPCALPEGAGTVVGSPSSSTIVTIRDGRLAAFRRVNGELKAVPLPRLPRIGAVVPIGLRNRNPRLLVREGRPDHDDPERSAVWRLAKPDGPEEAREFTLRRPPVVSRDERTVALIQENEVVAMDGEVERVRYRLPGTFDDATLSADGKLAAAWDGSSPGTVTLGGEGRPSCTAVAGAAVRFVVPSPSGRFVLLVGDYTQATLVDGATCAVVQRDPFQAKADNYISSAVVGDDGTVTGVILESVQAGSGTATRLVHFPAGGTPWAVTLRLHDGGASATRPAVAVGRGGRFLVHSLKGVALVRGPS